MINRSNQIWLSECFDNQYMEAYSDFTLKSTVKNAQMQIYCDTEYVLYINENFVSTGQYKSMDNKRVYDTVDVASFLKEGKNEILVWAYHQGTNASTYCTRPAGLAFALVADDSIILSGKETKVRPLACYKSGEMERITGQIGYPYYFDAREKPTSWQEPVIVSENAPFEKRPVNTLKHQECVRGLIKTQGYLLKANEGHAARRVQTDFMSWRLRKDVLENETVLPWRSRGEMIENTTVKFNKDGVYVIIDLEDEYAGLFTMDIDAPAGTVIDIAYGEHLDDMRVRAENYGKNFACRYTCKEGRQQFTGYFRRFAARYLQLNITGMTADIKLHKAGLIPTVYPLSREADFKCNDYFCNKLFDISLKTLKLCMHEHYEDCPWREQALYGFDSFVQMMCGYYAFGEYEFAKASIRLLADSMMENGLLRITSPNKDERAIPCFSLCWIMALEKYVLYSGDVDFAGEMLPYVKRILNAYNIKDNIAYIEIKKGIWHFYEWNEGLHGCSLDKNMPATPDAVLSMYYILAQDSVNKICSYLGLEPLCDSEPMKKAVREMFYDKEAGLFKTYLDSEVYHELTQSLALLSGCCTDVSDTIKKALISSDERLIKTDLSTSYYKYNALLSDGNEYLQQVMDEIAEVWGGMLYSGASTLWETALGAVDFDDSGSLCHAWSAVPVYVFYRYVLGFEPLAPGFKEYALNPCRTKNVTHVKAPLFMPGKVQIFDKEL